METSENRRIAYAKSLGEAMYKTLYEGEMSDWLKDQLDGRMLISLRVGEYTIEINFNGVTEYLHDAEGMTKVNEYKCADYAALLKQLHYSFWKGIRSRYNCWSGYDPSYYSFCEWLLDQDYYRAPLYFVYFLDSIRLAYEAAVNRSEGRI